jgi:ABC-type amino acid transport substrate-binding protein
MPGPRAVPGPPGLRALRGLALALGLAGAASAALATTATAPAERAAAAKAASPANAATAADAGSRLAQVQRRGELAVCIWPDYFGITWRDPRTGQLSGIDIDLSAELARDLGVRLRYVESSFATLIDDVRQQRCDVAMFAIGTLPQRREHLRFTRPYLQSDIYAVTTQTHPTVREWADIDKPGVAVAVAAGTFMEPVMRDTLKQARLVSVKAPDTRERELEAGRVDVFMTDFPYSRRLLQRADWARLITPPAPFYTLPYAYAVAYGDDAWFARVDAFVDRIQRDGRLMTAAQRHGLAPIVRLR